MNDDQALLASAYLDGELTAAERALAESDPAVMSGVEQLRVLRGQLRATAPASDSVREASIAAAMAEFRTVAPTAGRVASHTDRVVPFRPRPSSARYLGLAAAVVAVGVLGVVIARAPRGGGGDTTATDLASATMPTVSASDRQQTESADAPPAELTTGQTTADGRADAAESTLAPSAAGGPEPTYAALSPDVLLAPDAGRSRETALFGPDELGAFGRRLIELRDEGALAPTPNTRCTTPNVLDRAFFGEADDVQEVLVAVDENVGTVSAIDPDSCGALLTAPLQG
jgi:hypothetical protein